MPGTNKPSLTHVDSQGRANMVDVADKSVSRRLAVASGHVSMNPQTLAAIVGGDTKKGDVLATARIAGIMAAKKTHELIPLCHPLMLSRVSVEIDADLELPGLRLTASVTVNGQTGVEMEALTAVSVACLTIYDMAKSMDRAMEIGEIHLVEKSGGQSGYYHRSGKSEP